MAHEIGKKKDGNEQPGSLKENRGGTPPAQNPQSQEDVDPEMSLDRLRALSQRDPTDPRKIEKEIFKLDASTEEEVDALKVNLLQEDERANARDGSGRVVDEVAEETMTRFTEAGPFAGDRGAESVTPGRDDTSRTLRRHHPHPEIARAQDVVEGNVDEPREESRVDRKVDEGTAA